MQKTSSFPKEGILLVDKPTAKSSFYLVKLLRRLTHIQKIGHCGTLDPFATGVMVMLVGKSYTKQSQALMSMDKTYEATLELGKATDTYDLDGSVIQTSSHKPSLEDIQESLKYFQGTIEQIPPMYSAKKIGGQKLYHLARKGQTIERKPAIVSLTTELIAYHYPFLSLRVHCSKGTYIRSIAHDLGVKLNCFGHLSALKRTKSGPYSLDQCVTVDQLNKEDFDYREYLCTIA